MAEAIARNMGHEAMSAGTNPGSSVANNALKVLSELEVDVTGLYPKSVDSIDSTGFDKIISMGCGVECPALPIDEDWDLEDPYDSDLEFYKRTSDQIWSRLSELV